MKKVLKVLKYLLIIIILTIAGGLTYLKTALPNVGEPQEISIKGTPEQIKRGEYLAHNVMLCMDCHSQRDWTKFSGPLVDGTLGQGGEVFDQKLGFPGKYVASNITPYNLCNWTDGEILRAVTSGVGKDGRALFPVMPHQHYGKMDIEDIKAVISYIKTLKPIENQTEASESDFPMNFIINTIPAKAELSKRPNPTDKIAYGEYLVNAAACFDCHTKQEKGQFIGKPFAGGMEFKLPNNFTILSANITPHENGIGSWTEEAFIGRFKTYSDSLYTPHDVSIGGHQTVMPWTMYSGMKANDLSAIYAYLKTIEPVE